MDDALLKKVLLAIAALFFCGFVLIVADNLNIDYVEGVGVVHKTDLHNPRRLSVMQSNGRMVHVDIGSVPVSDRPAVGEQVNFWYKYGHFTGWYYGSTLSK